MMKGRPRRGSRLSAIHRDQQSVVDVTLVTAFMGANGIKYAVCTSEDWLDSHGIWCPNELDDAMGKDTDGELYLFRWDDLFDSYGDAEKELEFLKQTKKKKKPPKTIGPYNVVIPTSSQPHIEQEEDE